MQPTEKFFAASVRGISHVETGKPVQDYSLAVKGQDFCIAVVCDGHGGSKHFRSETGSRLAAEAARDKLLEFQAAYPDWERVYENLDDKLERLKAAILSEWQSRIERHERENRFTEEELKKVSSTFTARNAFDIASPYGTTLLLALICGDYYLMLMLGDGAIVKFTPDFRGEIVEFEGKEKFEDQPHSAVESMCDPYCYYKMYTKCGRRERGDGLLIALCSDGMSEAFATDNQMFSVMANYINFVAEEGIEQSDTSIPPHLVRLSKMSAAKDDVSFAFACNELNLYDKREKAHGGEEDNADREEQSAPAETESGAVTEQPEQPSEINEESLITQDLTTLRQELEVAAEEECYCADTENTDIIGNTDGSASESDGLVTKEDNEEDE